MCTETKALNIDSLLYYLQQQVLNEEREAVKENTEAETRLCKVHNQPFIYHHYDGKVFTFVPYSSTYSGNDNDLIVGFLCSELGNYDSAKGPDFCYLPRKSFKLFPNGEEYWKENVKCFYYEEKI